MSDEQQLVQLTESMGLEALLPDNSAYLMLVIKGMLDRLVLSEDVDTRGAHVSLTITCFRKSGQR